MKPQLLLPIYDEVSGHETILIIPGAASMDRSKLEELVQWATEKEQAAMRQRAPHPKLLRTVSTKEVGQNFKDFNDRVLKKNNRTGPRRYVPGGLHV